MKCGLVILNYKDYKITRNLLEAVKDYPEINHIAVVDNNSPNESYEVLKQYESDKITVLKSDRNGGYSYGNNIGIRHLIKNFSPDIIGIANPDVIFSNDYVKKIKKLFTKYNEYAVITGLETTKDGNIVLLFPDRDAETAYAILKQELKATVSTFSKIWHKIFRGKPSHNTVWENYVDEKLRKGSELIPVWKVHGAMFFVRVSDFQKIGLFDENIFMYREEEILAFRIHSIYKEIGIAPGLRFIHLFIHHFSGKRNSIMPYIRMALSYKNSKIYYFNHYVSDNKVLHVVNWTLSWTNMLRECTEALIRFTVKLFMHK